MSVAVVFQSEKANCLRRPWDPSDLLRVLKDAVVRESKILVITEIEIRAQIQKRRYV
jgi:hypothetical protein